MAYPLRKLPLHTHLCFRYLLSVWHDILRQNPTALNFINKSLSEIKYPHTWRRRPRDFSTYAKWKSI